MYHKTLMQSGQNYQSQVARFAEHLRELELSIED